MMRRSILFSLRERSSACAVMLTRHSETESMVSTVFRKMIKLPLQLRDERRSELDESLYDHGHRFDRSLHLLGRIRQSIRRDQEIPAILVTSLKFVDEDLSTIRSFAF